MPRRILTLNPNLGFIGFSVLRALIMIYKCPTMTVRERHSEDLPVTWTQRVVHLQQNSSTARSTYLKWRGMAHAQLTQQEGNT